MGERVWPVVLLVGSNTFMTFAWYGHLKFREVSLWKVILLSWGIAFFEYCRARCRATASERRCIP